MYKHTQSRTRQFWLPGRKPGMSRCPLVGSHLCRSGGFHRLTASRLRFAVCGLRFAAAAVEAFRCCGVLAFLRLWAPAANALEPEYACGPLDRFRITSGLESWPLVRFSSADFSAWWRHASRFRLIWGWLPRLRDLIGRKGDPVNEQGMVRSPGVRSDLTPRACRGRLLVFPCSRRPS